MRLRTACVVHTVVGCAVTPRMWTRRLAISRADHRVGAARWCRGGGSPWQQPGCLKVRQWVSIQQGAGPRCLAARMRRMVPVPMWCPSRVSSPWMRRCPQRGLSRASRMMSSRSSAPMRRRPGGLRIGPFLGDQALVPGQESGGGDESVATQLAGQEPGQGGQSARSGQVGRAGPSCRRSTMTSCRSVNVSAMSVLLRRQSSASQDSIRVMVR
jgi:hypothetical protein